MAQHPKQSNHKELTQLQSEALLRIERTQPFAKVVAWQDGCPIVRLKDWEDGTPVYSYVMASRFGKLIQGGLAMDFTAHKRWRGRPSDLEPSCTMAVGQI
jgi:hypothetical protein